MSIQNVISLNICILVTDRNLAKGTVIKQEENNSEVWSQGLLKLFIQFSDLGGLLSFEESI